MSKNVTGATGCSAVGVPPLNLLVSKFEAFKRNESKSSTNENSQSNAAKSGGSSNGPGTAGSSAPASSGSSESKINGSSADSGGSTTANNVAQEPPAEDDLAEMCSVTYISGNSEYARQKVEKGKNLLELPEEPSADEAHFMGWWTEKMGAPERKQFTIGTRVKEDITVFAKWVYIVTFYHNGQIVEQREIEVKTPGDTVNYSLELEPKPGGYDTGSFCEEE